MRSRLAGAFACVTAAAASTAGIAHCSAVTELVVVVDTDLTAGAEVDEIDVTVSDGAGFETHRSARVGPEGTSLPLTLGVIAGDDANESVTVRAVARLRGADVSSASLRTSFVEGESKLAHVSICRSCGASCATVDMTGAALPAWSGSPPSAAVCSGGPNGGDSGPKDDGGDGGIAEGGDDGPLGDADADAAIDPSLFAYYDFEETSGQQVVDRTGRGHHADITGIGAERAPGKIGQGIAFRRLDGGGENGQLDCDDHSDAGMFPSTGTLSFWWRDDDTAAAGALGSSVTVFSNQTSAQDHFFVSRFANDDAQELTLGFQFKTLDASTDDYANTTGANVPPPKFVVPRSVWTRIVITWGPNGGSRTIGTGLTTGFSFYRAWSPANQRCFFGRHAHGALDEVRFYTRELTPQEIAAIP